MLPEPEHQESGTTSTARRLSLLAEQSMRCAPACCGAVATISGNGPERRVSATHPDLAPLASVQLARNDGPIPSALGAGEPVDTDDLLTEDRWPRYRALALAAGVRTCVTLPFRRSGIEVTVSLYGYRPHSLQPSVCGPVSVLAGETTTALARDRRYRAALAEVEHLETALRSRPVIDQASGIVMHVLACESAAAFAVLRTISQRTNRKLAEVAEAVVRAKGRGLESELSALAASAD
ncbi:ANTAR domain-containing response regulator [Streptomyces sp. NPDC059161]|uniref:ANTAR domain-containing response regulator n=1 Tax=Streptomyces sp. NPDC059161 TaxID=3346749 RepID=UPI0036CBCB86